jgi:hypothetical protein
MIDASVPMKYVRNMRKERRGNRGRTTMTGDKEEKSTAATGGERPRRKNWGKGRCDGSSIRGESKKKGETGTVAGKVKKRKNC